MVPDCFVDYRSTVHCAARRLLECTAFGNATGGGVDASWWHNIMAVAIVVFVVWSVVIGLISNK